MIDFYLNEDDINQALDIYNTMKTPNSVTFSCFAKYYLNKKDLSNS